MADVTGPVSTLPGSVHKAEGPCDDCGQPATRRVQGETEGMHGPTYRVCKKCYDRQQAALTKELKEYYGWRY